LRTPTSDFNTTFGLAIAMVLLIQFLTIRKHGMIKYLGKYFQFKKVWQGFRKGISAGAVATIEFFVGLLDIVSEFAKIISLSLRLFGNMYAGTVLATILLGALAFILPSLWLGMSLLFAVVQAMVFGSLVAAYYSIAVQDEKEEEQKV
jgi:F-type H+-transporting ATPase subunit a